MNDKLNFDNYQYRLNQLHCDDVMRAVEQQRLAQLAADEPRERNTLMVGLTQSVRRFFSGHHPSRGGSHKIGRTLRHTPSAILVALFLSWVLMGRALPTRAQPPIIDPGHPEPNAELVHYGVGMYFQVHGSHERAIQEFTAAIQALPQVGDAYAARADSYVALKQYVSAITDYTRALELNGSDAMTYTKRAFAYASLGDLDAAQLDFGHAISMNSSAPS